MAKKSKSKSKSKSHEVVQPETVSYSPEEFEARRKKCTEAMAAIWGARIPNYAEGVQAIADYGNRPGGLIAALWTPKCLPPIIIHQGWLQLAYYDLLIALGPEGRKMYNIQVCIAGHSLEEPFDYVGEGVRVEFFDTQRQMVVPASANNNPDAFSGCGGNVFVVSYPLQRGLSLYTTYQLQLPV